jgi:hypothetical protein
VIGAQEIPPRNSIQQASAPALPLPSPTTRLTCTPNTVTQAAGIVKLSRPGEADRAVLGSRFSHEGESLMAQHRVGLRGDCQSINNLGAILGAEFGRERGRRMYVLMIAALLVLFPLASIAGSGSYFGGSGSGCFWRGFPGGYCRRRWPERSSTVLQGLTMSGTRIVTSFKTSPWCRIY